jgi:hypothetical protein
VSARGSATYPDEVILLLLAMLGILLLAGLVVVYVAYPHRGQDVPSAPWLGDAMRKGVARLPTIDNEREKQHH